MVLVGGCAFHLKWVLFNYYLYVLLCDGFCVYYDSSH